MKTIYFDCFSGISGDMTLGALIDLGADFVEIERQLKTLPCSGEFELHAEKMCKNGITGTSVTVRDISEGKAHHRMGYSLIKSEVLSSDMSENVKRRALKALKMLATAEANVHGCSIEEVHFHEVGAIDTLVDICGSAIALECLGAAFFVCSPVNLGGGFVTFSHGRLSVPAPAVARLLEGFPAYGDIARVGELTTPTGAAIVASLCDSYGTMPQMKIISSGYGFGQKEIGKLNALRILYGESGQNENSAVMIETNIDDMTPEALSFAAERIREAGSVEVYFTPVIMKKGRPGQLLSALCLSSDVAVVEKAIFAYTSTLGIRKYEVERTTLKRQMTEVDTSYGKIRIKHAMSGEKILHSKPEYEDCSIAAWAHGVSIADVQIEAMKRLENK